MLYRWEMDLHSLFRWFDTAFRVFERLFDFALVVIGAAFGAWVVWSISTEAEIGLLTKVGASLVGAIVGGILMRLFWLVARLFA